MNDGEVLDEIAAAKRALKSAEELSRARVTYIDRLERLRRVAGDWADLVPRVR